MLKLQIIKCALVLPLSFIISTVKLCLNQTFIRAFGHRGELRELKDSTAIMINESLSIDECDELINKFDECICNYRRDNDSVEVWKDDSGSDTRIFYFEKLLNEDLLLRLDVETKIKMVELYLGRKVRSWGLMANRVSYEPKNIGSGGGWHRDSPFSHQIKFIWYLTKVTEDCGPFQYVLKSNSSQSKTKYGLGRYRFKEEEIIGEIKTAIGNRGSIVICDTAAIHRGAPIGKKCVRYALTLYTSLHKSGVSKTFNLNG